MSLEREFADRLEVKPGDALTVSVAGVELPARVDSVRAVQWFRFQPSFFILLHPEDLAGAPLNYVGLFNGVSDLRALQRGLQAQYPNVTVIDSKSVAERLVTLIDRVILAISSLGIFVLIAAAWVYVAIIVSRRAAFRQDLYLIRLMGGSGAALRKLARRHFVFLSLSTGIIASALAIASSWVLAGSVFGIALSWSAATWSMGGAVLISGVFALVGYALSGPYSRWLNASQQELNF
jgi:putative ABC transport system permease protein